MSLAAEIVLLGDIGATNARFAILTDGRLGSVTWVEVARYRQIEDAIGHLLASTFRELPPSSALLAVAGPVDGERCAFTNCAWTVDGREMRNQFNFKTVRVINDFEATALSLPELLNDDVCSLGGGRAITGAPIAVLGPGSGLGVAALVTDGPRRIVIANEGGHATLAAVTRREDAILDHLRQDFGHVSAERVLSGPGLENIYRAIAALDEVEASLSGAAAITHAALEGTCSISRQALDMFCAMLGGFAGNVALTYGARGGVYIAGGIAPRIVEYLSGSGFRQRFEQKGRFRRYLQDIPSKVIVHPAATFLGLKSLVEFI